MTEEFSTTKAQGGVSVLTQEQDRCTTTFPCMPLDKICVNLSGARILGSCLSVAVTAGNGHQIRMAWLDGNSLRDEWFPAPLVTLVEKHNG